MNAFVSSIVVLASVAVASAGVFPAAAAYYGVPVGARFVGYEGQYIPDNLERLYDDGSYRPGLRAVPLAASPYGLTPAGSGLEGAYVHDNLEKLYDDGSYRPGLSPLPLAASPYGLTPAGSGLEGAYVPDITEKLFDDGSYKPLPHVL